MERGGEDQKDGQLNNEQAKKDTLTDGRKPRIHKTKTHGHGQGDAAAPTPKLAIWTQAGSDPVLDN